MFKSQTIIINKKITPTCMFATNRTLNLNYFQGNKYSKIEKKLFKLIFQAKIHFQTLTSTLSGNIS